MNSPRQQADQQRYSSDAKIDAARARHAASATAIRTRLKSLAQVVGGALFVALALRSLVFEPFTITSASMQPGLLVGDYLFVAKWPYGYSRYSFPLAMPFFDGRLPARLPPRRGDVVIFKSPVNNRTDYIKRVIGLPGDRISMAAGHLVLNGIPISRQVLTIGKSDTATLRYREMLPGRSYIVDHSVVDPARDSFDPVTVPAGHIFMLGDNRDDSADSRLMLAEGGVGMVPLVNLIGRADRVFFSVDAAKLGPRPRDWPAAVRTARIGVQF